MKEISFLGDVQRFGGRNHRGSVKCDPLENVRIIPVWMKRSLCRIIVIRAHVRALVVGDRSTRYPVVDNNKSDKFADEWAGWTRLVGYLLLSVHKAVYIKLSSVVVQFSVHAAFRYLLDVSCFLSNSNCATFHASASCSHFKAERNDDVAYGRHPI